MLVDLFFGYVFLFYCFYLCLGYYSNMPRRAANAQNEAAGQSKVAGAFVLFAYA